jgi:hypothetical protein
MGGYLILSKLLQFAVLLTFIFTPYCQAKQKKASLAAPTETEIALAEVQAKFKEEQPGYIAELGVLDAEMQIALALYQTSHVTEARAHLSHADVVIYRRLLNRVLARRAVGFSGELTLFSKAISVGESYKSVKPKHERLKLAIAASRGKGSLVNAAPMAAAIGILLRKSEEYYNSGVANGQVVNAAQYQDSWGYMKAAQNLATGFAKSDRKKFKVQLDNIDNAISSLKNLWPNLTNGDADFGGTQALGSAAANVESIVTQLQTSTP